MEYRRRTVRRKKNEGGAGGFLRALILIIVFGAAAYLIFGTGVGKRIKENFSVSLLDRLGIGAKVTPEASAVPIASPTASPTAAPSGETLEVALPGIDVFMLQMGIFNSAGDAAPLAERLKAMGAAGYVYDDLGSFRLIAAAYSDEASAESVRDRLVSEGYEVSIYRLSRSGVELLVTAPPERLLPIRTAFGVAFDAVSQLDELAIDFDSESRSIEYGLGVLSEMRTNISNALSGIGDSAGQDPMLSRVSDNLSELSRLIGDAASSSADRTAFSSALKCLRIKAALRYAELLAGIGE